MDGMGETGTRALAYLARVIELALGDRGLGALDEEAAAVLRNRGLGQFDVVAPRILVKDFDFGNVVRGHGPDSPVGPARPGIRGRERSYSAAAAAWAPIAGRLAAPGQLA